MTGKCVFLNPPPVCLCVRVRCVLHHHAVVPVEGDGHHAGELSASLHPQVPEETLLTAQLLQADHITTQRSLEPGPGLCGTTAESALLGIRTWLQPLRFLCKDGQRLWSKTSRLLTGKKKKKASVDKQVFVP